MSPKPSASPTSRPTEPPSLVDNERGRHAFMAYGEWAGGPGGEGPCVLCQQLGPLQAALPRPVGPLPQAPPRTSSARTSWTGYERAGHRLHPAGGAQGLGLHPPHGLRAQVPALAGLSLYMSGVWIGGASKEWLKAEVSLPEAKLRRESSPCLCWGRVEHLLLSV